MLLWVGTGEKKALGQAPTNTVVDANSFYNLFDYTTGTAATGSAWIAQQGSSPSANPPLNQQIRLGVGTGGITVSGYTGTLGTALGSAVQRLNNQEYYETRTRPGTGGAGQEPAVEEWRVRPGITWSGALALPSEYYGWRATTVANGGTPPNLPVGRVYPDPFESSHWTGGVTPASPNVTVQDTNNRTLGFQAGGPTMATHGSRATLTFEGYDAGNGSGGVIFNGGGTYSIIGQSNTVVRFGAPTLAFTNTGANTWRWQFNYPAGNAPTQDRIVYSRVYFVNNKAASGGAIDNAGTLTLTRVTLNANEATGSVTTPGFGGAISNILGGTLILDDTSFGGAIPATSILLPTGPNVLTTPAYLSALGIFLPGGLGNTTQVFAAPQVAYDHDGQGNVADYGGAIYNLGVVEGNANAQNYVNFLDGTQHYPGIIFANNRARISGGAIFNDQGGTILASAGGAGHVDRLFRGTFVGNFAVLHGGAIFNDKSGAIFNDEIDGIDGVVRVRGNFDYNYVTGNIAAGGRDAGHGGAIYNVAGGDVTLDGVELLGNVAGGANADALTNTLTGYGGAIYSLGTLNFGRDRQAGDTGALGTVTFTNNRALQGGGIYSMGGMTSRSFAYFTRNEAREDGGAIYNLEQDVVFSDATFMGNLAGRDGGALYNSLGEITLATVRFSGNRADGVGGAIANIWGVLTLGTPAIDGASRAASFTDNEAAMGGAVFNDHGTITLADGSFTNNTATGRGGGALFNDGGTFTVIDRIDGGRGVTFTRNSATQGSGGAIFNEVNGEITIVDGTFASNFAELDGGAIYNREDGKLLLQNVNFQGNWAVQGSGGAVFNEKHGLLVVENVGGTVNSFTNSTAAVDGGAIYNQGIMAGDGGTLDLTNVEFLLNVAQNGDGGAIYNGLNGKVTITASDPARANMFAGNRETEFNAGNFTRNARFGGAIFNDGLGIDQWDDRGEMDITSARFLRNVAVVGGAVHNRGQMLIDNRGLAIDLVSFASNVAVGDAAALPVAISGDGGAIYNAEFGDLILHQVSFLRNEAERGGAVFNANNSTLDVTSGIARDALTSEEGTFTLNKAEEGGAIYNAGTLTLTGVTSVPGIVTFSRNEALNGGHGGAIYNAPGATITLNNVSFANNAVDIAVGGRGAAIYNDSATIYLNVTAYNQGIRNNYHGADSVFARTDDVYFENKGNMFNVHVGVVSADDPAIDPSVPIEEGDPLILLMMAGMGGGADVEVSIRKTGDGRWIFENAPSDFSGGVAHFDVYAGSLELGRNVGLDLGGGDFTLHGAGSTYFVDGQMLTTTAGNMLKVDQNTLIAANTFTLSDVEAAADRAILEFSTRSALAGDQFLTLLFTGATEGTVDVSRSNVYIEDLRTQLEDRSLIYLISVENGTFANNVLPTLWIYRYDADGNRLPNPEEVLTSQFVRNNTDENPELFYGLRYVDGTQLALGLESADAAATLHWTGAAADNLQIWDEGTGSSANWRGMISGNLVSIFLNGDTVIFANNDGHGNTVRVDRKKVNVENNVRVQSMTVTGSDYEFNLDANIRAANSNTATPAVGQDIHFGSARISVWEPNQGRTITARTITFSEGSVLNFHAIGWDDEGDVWLAGHGDVFLTLSTVGGTIDLNDSVISVIAGGEPLFENAGEYIVLVRGNGGTLARTSLGADFFLDGQPYDFTRIDGGFAYSLALVNNELRLVADTSAGARGNLTWTGTKGLGDFPVQFQDAGIWDVDTTSNWQGTVAGRYFAETKFFTGDVVTFADKYRDPADTTGAIEPEEDVENKTVLIGGAIEVGAMHVTGDNYTFVLGDPSSLALAPLPPGIEIYGTISAKGNPALAGATGNITITGEDTKFVFGLTDSTEPLITATGTINLGGAWLTIAGYDITDAEDYERDAITIIQAGAGNAIQNFNPVIFVAGFSASDVDFLSARAYQGVGAQANRIFLETGLTWYSTDPDRPAHGDFTIDAGESFTLGAVLQNRTGADNRRTGDPQGLPDWDGNTLFKKGEGTLILTGNNTYSGLTTVEEGTLQVGTSALRNAVVAGAVTLGANTTLDVYGRVGGAVTVGAGGDLNVRSGGGQVAGSVSAEQNATVNVAGTVTGNIAAQHGGEIEVSVNGNVSGAVNVGANSKLSGSGTIGGAATVGAKSTLSAGTIGSVGTLNVGSLAMANDSILQVDMVGSSLDRISVAGGAVFTGIIEVELNSQNWVPGTHTIVSTGSGVTGNKDSFDLNYTADVHRKAEIDVVGNNVVLTLETVSAKVHWTGVIDGDNNSLWRNDTSLRNWQDVNNNATYFANGDEVIFGQSNNKRVDVHSSGVTVDSVDITETGYTFNLGGTYGTITAVGDEKEGTPGNIKIADGVETRLNLAVNQSRSLINANGNIDLGNGQMTINITGYTPIGNSLTTPTPITVISADGGIANLDLQNITLQLDGGADGRDFLLVGLVPDDDNAPKTLGVQTWLMWYCTNTDIPAHGDFTVANNFTLGAVLEDITEAKYKGVWDNRRVDNPDGKPDWDGTTLTKLGAGTLVLTGNNTYTGTTTVTTGTLQIGSGTTGSISNASNIVNNATVEFNRSNDYTYSGAISGDGSVEKGGTGRVTLSGVLTYTGETTVKSGTLQFGDGTTTDEGIKDEQNKMTVENNANLVFNHAEDNTYIYEGFINGGGRVTIASGTFLLGENEDTVAVIGTDVHVLAAGTLGGHGRINGKITLAQGGTLSPGSSPGTLSIGSITFESGSIYLYEIGKLLEVAAGGKVEIHRDAFLDINNIDGAVPGEALQVIKVENANQMPLLPFTHVGNFGGTFKSVLRNDGYYLEWNRFADNIGDPWGRTNAGRAADAMDRVMDAGELPLELWQSLVQLPQRELRGAFQQLHGEVFAANQEAVMQTQRRFQDLLPTGQDFVVKPRTVGERPKLWDRWGTVTGTFHTRSNIGHYSGYELNTSGFAAGMHRNIVPNMMVGAALGYDNSNTSFNLLRSKNKTDSLRSLAYVSWFNGKFYVDGYGGYTKNWHNTTRNIDINALGNPIKEIAKGKYNDDLISTGVNLGRVFWINDVTTLAPGAGFHYARVNSPSVTESGAPLANLHVFRDHYQSFRTSLGARASRIYGMSEKVVLTPEIRGYYIREWADDEAIVRTEFAGFRSGEYNGEYHNLGFNAHSGRWGRNIGQLGLGLGVLVSDRFNFRLDYDHEAYSHTSVDTLRATLGITW